MHGFEVSPREAVTRERSTGLEPKKPFMGWGVPGFAGFDTAAGNCTGGQYVRGNAPVSVRMKLELDFDQGSKMRSGLLRKNGTVSIGSYF